MSNVPHAPLAHSDLAYNYTAEAIFENLARCWDVAQAHGSKVLVLTVPEVAVGGGAAMQRIHGQRDELNRLIRNAQGGNMFGSLFHTLLASAAPLIPLRYMCAPCIFACPCHPG